MLKSDEGIIVEIYLDKYLKMLYYKIKESRDKEVLFGADIKHGLKINANKYLKSDF